ncbi:uncharacterized protein LOC121872737 isoform X3 [Homarus americanus]|uniref:uncharacterized protein LOC121872737 isoform X3 n=1 Tax=Homarus americanus TaxID=6706 RepID=UPI001C4787F7|nr:uncharacterized protein LOC121872737 isoform X3 [Homarus americanus]
MVCFPVNQRTSDCREVMDAIGDSSYESALQSPDSAIGVTPTVTPDEEFQNRVPEKPDIELKQTKESMGIEKYTETIEPEPQKENEENDRSISILTLAEQKPQELERQQLEENSESEGIQSASDEGGSHPSSSSSSIVIVEKEDMEEDEGNEDGGVVAQEKDVSGNEGVEDDDPSGNKHASETKSESFLSHATSSPQLLGEQELLVEEKVAADETAGKAVDSKGLGEGLKDHSNILAPTVDTEIKQQQLEEDKMETGCNTSLSPSATQSQYPSSLSGNLENLSGSTGNLKSETQERISISPSVSATDDLTKVELKGTTDVETDASVLSTNAGSPNLESRAQQSMSHEMGVKTSGELVTETVKEDLEKKVPAEPVKQLVTQNSVEADLSFKSEEGYEEDEEDTEGEEVDISDSEMVVSASMQFPLTRKPELEESTSSSPKQMEQEESCLSQDSHATLGSSPGVTVRVQSRITLSPPKETSPSGSESDVEDNDEEDSKEEEAAHPLTKPSLALISRIPSSIQLPDTVTRLDTPHGSSVFLVGTAHFSKESQDDVANTIRTVKPDIVVVELCKARTAILQLDEETILQESRSLDFKKMQMILRQHGKIQGVLYLLLLSVSAHITKQLGMAPGGEFRTAFAEARRSAPGCLIQLGDRPIQVTLSRALASLSLWHKVKLTWHILTSKEPISKEEVEKCKQRDFIEEMLAEMTGQFPAISEVFVKERDLYLCRSLQAAAQPVPNPLSPSGISPRVVVGVVGIGHVPGIVNHWGKVTDADIAPIMKIPPPSLSNTILKMTFKISMYGLLGYGVYKCLPSSAKSTLNSSVQSAISSVSNILSQQRQK